MVNQQKSNPVLNQALHPMPYTWQELKAKWEHDRISNEQTIGQLVVWGELLYNQLLACQRELDRRARQIDEMAVRLHEWQEGQGRQEKIKTLTNQADENILESRIRR